MLKNLKSLKENQLKFKITFKTIANYYYYLKCQRTERKKKKTKMVPRKLDSHFRSFHKIYKCI